MRRVVITGIGIYSSIGVGAGAVEESLRTGRSGVGIDEQRTALGYRSALTGIVPLPDARELLDRKSRGRYAEQGLYALVAAREALQQAQMTNDYLSGNETGIIMGCDGSGKALIEGYDVIRERKNTTLVGSGNAFQAMTSTTSMTLASTLGLKGISMSIAAACASSSHAIGIATAMIRSGMQERVLCGGAQEVNPYALMSFDGLQVFSTHVSDPTKASRPFDTGRDGLVPSGGAAMLVVETLESAMERGAKPIAEIAGYGFGTGCDNLTVPSVVDTERAMLRAMADAGIQATDVDYVNAHATSTQAGDRNEAEALTNIFGDSSPWISSTKSMTGHELWAAGACEAVYTLIMMQKGFIAPNINMENKDAAAQKLNIVTSTTDAHIRYALSNSLGFGGTNSCLVLKTYEECGDAASAKL